jgi:chromosome segregation ATPase
MNGKKPSDKPSRMADLERQLEEAKDKEATAERRAGETLEQAEQLAEKSRELGEEDEEIRKKAAEPIGFPPPARKQKRKGTDSTAP